MLDAEPSPRARGLGPLALRVLAAAAALALAACAPEPEPPVEEPLPGEDPSLIVTLSESSLSLLRGASTTLEVDVTRAGPPTGDVTLAVDGALPAGVTAVFDPPTLGLNESTSLLTVSADATTADTAFELVVAGAAADLGNGSAEAEASLIVDVNGLTVQGRVRDVFGRVLRDVLVGSQGKRTVTGPDGGFTLTDLAVPYDLMLVRRDVPALHEYEGLTAADPDLVVYHRFQLPAGISVASLNGYVAGGAPLPAGEMVFVCAEGLNAVVYGCDPVEGGEDSYELQLSWHTRAPQEVRVHAFHALLKADDTVDEYLGYSVVTGTIGDGDAFTRDLVFEPVDTTTLTGTVVRGQGGDAMYDPVVLAAVRFSDRLSMVVSGGYAPGAFAMAVPSLPGEGWEYDVLAGDGLFTSASISAAWSTVVGPDIGQLELADVPSLVRPAHGTTGVTQATGFEVAGLGGRAKTFSWVHSDGYPSFALTTMSDVVTMPDPSEVGLAVAPPAGVYEWGALSARGGSVDEEAGRMAASISAVTSLYGRFGGAPTDDGLAVLAGQWEFELD